MKILHLISSSGLFGAEQILITLARGMNQQDQSIIGVIVDERNPDGGEPLINKARYFKIPVVVFKSRGRVDFSTLKELKNFIQTSHVDILHTHNYKSDMLGLLGRCGKPIIATAHGFTDVTHQVSLYEKIDRFILKSFFDRVVVVTNQLLSDFPKLKRRVIRNGLDLSRFATNDLKRQEIRTSFGISDDHIVVATVGRLSKEKNQTLLLKAACRLNPYYPNLRFLIIGNGPEEENLKQFIKQKDLSKCVIMAGHIAQIESVYQAMDIFALTSLTEGVPLTILEAMASHIPVIATKVGGIPEIIQHGKNGILINSDDETALSETIGDLMRNETHRNLLQNQAFSDVQEKFSSEKMIEEYRKVYLELTN
jgi:glycosyltransferase involved in cell wall biosynthesis